MVCSEFLSAVQIGSSQKSITSEAEQVFAIDRTIVFREVSAEETRLEELQRINREAQKGHIGTERTFSARQSAALQASQCFN